MFDALSDKLQRVFSRLSSHGTVSEKDLDEALREVRVALLEADVNFRVVREFVNAVRERAQGTEVLQSLTGPQQVIAIVNEELTKLLGGQQAGLVTAPQPPTVVLLLGLKGSGKTTLASKLALYLRKNGGKPLLVAADPYRVAASQQLQTLGRQLGFPVFAGDLTDTQELRQAGDRGSAKGRRERDHRRLRGLRPAGRRRCRGGSGAGVGVQAARDSAGRRRDDGPGGCTRRGGVRQGAVPVTGFVLTKLDGDARGGAALSIRAITGLPVKFIGTGERADALEAFHPERFASRILGMGDVLTPDREGAGGRRPGRGRTPRQAG